jgi:hypothetical protein
VRRGEYSTANKAHVPQPMTWQTVRHLGLMSGSEIGHAYGARHSRAAPLSGHSDVCSHRSVDVTVQRAESRRVWGGTQRDARSRCPTAGSGKYLDLGLPARR